MWQSGDKKESFFSIFLASTCSRRERREQIQTWRVFRERMCNLSLGFPAFGSSDFFGPRSKVVLRNEGYAWAPVSRIFDKIREVGVLSYLIYPFLSVL